MNDQLREETLISVVNCVMSLVSGRDEELRIENVVVPVYEIIRGHGVHVVDDSALKYVVVLDAQVTTIVSGDDVVTKLSPFSRGVEHLVHPSVETEGLLPDLTL